MEEKGLDINFFIGIFLIFGLLMWFNINQIPDEKINDSVLNESAPKKQTQLKIKPEITDSHNLIVNQDIKEELYSISNENIIIKFSNLGGAIKEVILKKYFTHDSQPLKIIKELDFDFSFFLKDLKIHTKNLVFTDVEEDLNRIAFVYKDINQNKIKFIYHLDSNSYNLKFNVQTENGNVYIEPHKFTFSQNINQLEKNINNERNTTTINYSFNNSSSKQMSLMKDGEKNINNPIWIAHKQQFFSTVINSENHFRDVILSTETPSSDKFVKRLSSEFSIDYDNESNNYFFDFYFLPNQYSLLKSYDKGFESLVPLGKFVFGWVNKFLVIPMFNFLETLGLNYGIIILIIAIVIKIILYWPTRSSYISMAKMRVLKPEIDALNEKFKDPLQKQQAQMNLYRKTGVNPLGGCLPLLFQMPILIALFRFFPASIELRQQPFLWADDLSTYDSVLDFGFSIPLYGDHISLFALLMTLATVLQMMYSNQISSSAQMPQMKYVMYMMPVIFLLVMNNYSAALSYYYFLANIITFMQQLIIRRGIDDDKLYSTLQANKKKVLKKSKFQMKLEEMAKKNK
ncbi:MAG: membrane protein insertase YidC [Flavobacteriales bacterium]|nr:membrane protein insertase YidC [Flavobacteriales bacterium]